MAATAVQPRLVVQPVGQLDAGALENGLFNWIRHMPPERCRHAIVCLNDSSVRHPRICGRDIEVGARHGMRVRSQLIARHSLPAMARGNGRVRYGN